MRRLTTLPRNDILVGDAATELSRLPKASVDMLLTSPPYFNLRNYDVDGQLGLEDTADQWVDNLLAVAREAHRVLVPSGSFWLNVADSYSTHTRQGAPAKSLLLGPERLTLRLLADGWILRNKIVWAKRNPMPSSVRDRLNCTWEALYILVKQPRYFFDLDGIRQPHRSQPPTHQHPQPQQLDVEAWRGLNADTATGLTMMKASGRVGHPLGKNPGDVWQLAASNFRGAHHATFPVALAERAIRAGCPQARCVRCRAPWRQETIRGLGGAAVRGVLGPSCDCQAPCEPGLVLDPFFGAGSTAIAAEQLDRDWLGVELNPDFAALAHQRITTARARPPDRRAA